MTGWWRPVQDVCPRSQAPVPAARGAVDTLLETAYQESTRADGKSAALLTIVGIGFTAFSAAGAAAVAAPLRGPAQWLSLAAIAGVCAVAELLLLALRPTLGSGFVGQRYFATWRRYNTAPAALAAELSADPDDCRTLIDVSRIVWRKYLLIRRAVDLLLTIVPVVAVALSIALMIRLSPTRTARPAACPPSGRARRRPHPDLPPVSGITGVTAGRHPSQDLF